MFNLNSHEKVIYVIFFFYDDSLWMYGRIEVNTNNETTTGITTRAVGVVVWEAQPGTVDIPFGQAVTIGLDGSVTK